MPDDVLQKVAEVEPSQVSNSRELRDQARVNTGAMKDLREQIDKIDRQQQSLINEGRVEEALPFQSSKEALEKKLQKRRKRSEALRRRREELQSAEREKRDKKERLEREERVEARNPGKQADLEARKNHVLALLDGIAQDSESLLRSARTHQDHDLARRLMGLQRGTVAALEAMKRTPSLNGFEERNG